MKKSFALACFLFLLVLFFASVPVLAEPDTILGKWIGSAETPNGPLEMEIELRQEGGKLVGTVAMMQETITMSAAKFEEPSFSAELGFGGNNYKLMGTLKDGKIAGTWEQVGGDMKGAWSAARKAPAAVETTTALGIAGSWDTISSTPNGELALALDLKQEGENISGMMSSEMGTVSIRAASFKENKLQFDVELGGTVYRVEGLLKGDKMEGKWYPAAGGEGGSWNATRKPAGPASAAQPATAAPVNIEGTWNSTAETPGGDLAFQIVFKLASGIWAGQISTSDGTIPVQKVSFSDNKLSFEVDYMGETYRIEAILANGKFTGKWSSVGGSDTGAWSSVKAP